MGRLSASFAGRMTPLGLVSDLFSLRSNPEAYSKQFLLAVKDNPDFIQCPFLSTKKIREMKLLLQKGSDITEVLKSVTLKFEFSIEKIQQYSIIDPNDPYNINQILFLFQCIAWLKLDPQQIKAEDFIMIIASFSSIHSSLYKDIQDEMFVHIVLFMQKIETIQLSQAEFSIIFEYLILNKHFDSWAFPFVLCIMEKSLEFKDKQSVFSALNFCRSIFLERRRVIDPGYIPCLITMLLPFISELNPSAISVLIDAAAVNSSTSVSDAFVIIPTTIFSMISASKPQINVSDCTKALEMEPNNEIPSSFDLPPPSLVESDCNLKNLVGPTICDAIAAMEPHFNEMNKNAPEFLINTIAGLEIATKGCDHFLDYIVSVCPLIRAAGKLVDISSIQLLLFNDVTFNTSVNIFCGSLPTHLNFVRNSIMMAVASKPEFLESIISSYSNYPFMVAEFVTRLMYVEDFAEENLFSGDSAVNMLLKIVRELPEKGRDYARQMNLARSVCLAYIFDLFSEPKIALLCFGSVGFMNDFTSLMFEPRMRNSVIQSLSKALSGLDELPVIVDEAISEIFRKCAREKENTDIALELARTLTNSLIVNRRIISHIEPLLSPFLEVAKITKLPQDMEVILSMLFALAQAKGDVRIPQKDFNIVIDIIHENEGDESSESTCIKLFNMLSNSSSLGATKMFTVRCPTAVPYILAVFQKSSKLDQIIKFFIELCKYSEANIYKLHDGNLSLILLKALKGDFEYDGHQYSFSLSEEIISNAVFPLLSVMTQTKSSCAVDREFISLFLPDSKCNFSPLGIQALQTLNSVLCNIDSRPNPDIAIGNVQPLFRIGGLSSSIIKDGFILCFYMKVDVVSSTAMNEPFCLFNYNDRNGAIFRIYFQCDKVFVEYNTKVRKTCAAVIRGISTNEWKLYTLAFAPSDDLLIVYPFVDQTALTETEFKSLTFGESLVVEGCFAIGSPIPSGDPCPVHMGPFRHIIQPLVEEDVNGIVENGYEYAKRYKFAFSDESVSKCFEKALMRQERNINNTMPQHIIVEEFYPLFETIATAPPMYAELVFQVIMHGTNLKSRATTESKRLSPSMEIPSEDYCDTIISQLTGISTEILKQYPISNKPEVSMSDLTGIFFLIPQLAQKLISFSLFASATSILNSITSERNRLEGIENIIYNLWIWSAADEVSINRIFSHWTNKVENTFSDKLYQMLLIQGYFISKFKNNMEKGIIRVLDEISSISVSPNDLEMLICVIVVKNNLENSQLLIKHLQNMVNNGVRISESVCLYLLDLVPLFDVQSLSQIIGILFTACPESCRFIATQFGLKFFASQNDQKPLNVDFICIQHILRGDASIELDPFRNVLVETSQFWFFWPLVVAMWQPSSIPIAVDYIVTPLLYSTSFKEDYDTICLMLNLCESLMLFDVNDLRIELISKLISSVKTLDEEKRASVLRMSVIISFIELFVELTNEVQSTALLELFASTESEMTDKSEREFCRNIVSSRADFRASKCLTNKNFDMKHFLSVLGQSLDGYEYTRRRNKDDPRLWQICKEMHELSLEAEQTELMSEITVYLEKHSEGKPEYSDPSIITKILEMSAPFRIERTIELKEKIVQLVTPVPSNSKTEYINKKVNDAIAQERSRIHQMIIHSKIRSQIIRENTNSKTPISRFISDPIAKFSPQTHPVLFNPLHNYQMGMVTSNTESDFRESGPQYVASVVVISTDLRIEAKLVMMLVKMRIVQLGNQPLAISYQSVSAVIPVGDTIAEVHMFSCETVRLEFENKEERSKFIGHCQRLHLPTITNPLQFLESVKTAWSLGKISNFEVLLLVNFIFGNTLNDHTNYPMLPAILLSQKNDKKSISFVAAAMQFDPEKRSEKLRSISLKSNPFEVAAEQSEEFRCFIPEIYASTDCFGDALAPYTMRKWLELAAMDEKVGKWITTVFGVPMPRRLFSSKAVRATHSLPKTDFIQCALISETADTIYALTNKGLATFYFDWSDSKVVLQKQSNCPPFENGSTASTVGKYLIVVDVKNCRAVSIDAGRVSTANTASIAIKKVASAYSRIVFATEDGMVFVSQIMSFPSKFTPVFAASSDIQCISASASLDLVAIATSNSVSTASLSSRETFGTFALEFVKNIIVTSEFGFVVCETDNEIVVLSPGCREVSRAPKPFKKVLKWVAASSNSGSDYVYSADDTGRLFLFEAPYPANVKQIASFDHQIYDIMFSVERNTLLVVTQNGSIELIPLIAQR